MKLRADLETKAHTILIWNNLLMTLIAAGTFLLESGAYLNSGDNSARTQESQTLKTTTQECINGILSSMAHTFGNVFALDPSSVHLEDSHFKALDGLPLIWPAYVASKAPGITNAQRRFLKNTLSAIGEVAHVPKAIALVKTRSLPGKCRPAHFLLRPNARKTGFHTLRLRLEARS